MFEYVYTHSSVWIIYIYTYMRCMSGPAAQEVEQHPSFSKASTKRFEMALVLRSWIKDIVKTIKYIYTHKHNVQTCFIHI